MPTGNPKGRWSGTRSRRAFSEWVSTRHRSTSLPGDGMPVTRDPNQMMGSISECSRAVRVWPRTSRLRRRMRAFTAFSAPCWAAKQAHSQSPHARALGHAPRRLRPGASSRHTGFPCSLPARGVRGPVLLCLVVRRCAPRTPVTPQRFRLGVEKPHTEPTHAGTRIGRHRGFFANLFDGDGLHHPIPPPCSIPPQPPERFFAAAHWPWSPSSRARTAISS